MRVVIVLPTYNERENIGLLLDALLAQRTVGMSHELRILVCDDDSPDRTADVVRSRQASAPCVHLSMGRKAGLGAAYARGMRIALDELDAEVVIQMDADLSHDPSDVPRLLAALDAGADIAIGSRYVHGGRLPHNWSGLRRAISRWGNRVARYLVGLHPIRDCTSGFRAIRASVLRLVAFESIRVQGYAFLVALLYETKLTGARITEIPIAFADRARGDSKLGISDIIEFAVNAVWLRFRSVGNFGRFLWIGGSGVVVNLGAFTLLLEAGMNKYAASPLAVALSILSNVALHSRSRCGLHAGGDTPPIRLLKFNLVSLVTLTASYSTFVAVSELDAAMSPQLSQLAGIPPATIVNYFLNAYWTRRQHLLGHATSRLP